MLVDKSVLSKRERRSRGGGDVGRPSLARARFALRTLLAWLTQRLVRELALDISLPLLRGYRPAVVVRVRVYEWLCKVWHLMKWVL